MLRLTEEDDGGKYVTVVSVGCGGHGVRLEGRILGGDIPPTNHEQVEDMELLN